MVAHHHQGTRAERRVKATRRVGQHDDPRAKLGEQEHWLDDQPRVEPLVQVKATLKQDDRSTAEPTEQQPSGVTRRRRRRPAGQLTEWDGDCLVEVVGEAAEPGSEHDADLGDDVRSRTDGRSQRFDEGWLIRRLDRPGRVELFRP